MIEANGVDYVVLRVNDFGWAKKFYTEILEMTVYRQDEEQFFLRAGQQGFALFRKPGDAPLIAGQDLDHLAFNSATGTYETLKTELEKRGVPVNGRPGDHRRIYFGDSDRHHLQLVVRA